jgi:lipopolysaccharide cholinephosphotransferase
MVVNEQVSLIEAQKIMKESLYIFDDFCKKYNLRYYLMFGTLIGAVRHADFIPWDDDLDICMPREDYDRLWELRENFDDRFEINSYETYRDTWTPEIHVDNKELCRTFSKIFDKRLSKKVPIDIFVLDKIPNDIKVISKTKKRIIKDTNLLNFKYSFVLSKNPIKRLIRKILLFILKPVSSKKVCKKLEDYIRFVSSKANGQKDYLLYMPHQGTEFVYTNAIYCFSPKLFEEPIYITFGERKLPCPKQYDVILSMIYGDYMQLPPKEKQITSCSFFIEREINEKI